MVIYIKAFSSGPEEYISGLLFEPVFSTLSEEHHTIYIKEKQLLRRLPGSNLFKVADR